MTELLTNIGAIALGFLIIFACLSPIAWVAVVLNEADHPVAAAIVTFILLCIVGGGIATYIGAS